ncbi:MAG: ATP-binding cassette domain-containing protein [Candidatus Cloacimonetes bacterium]|nr:ATP-binding cassette domain-containing protein [Candidatus Cloacimonadota bacterium]
MLKKKVTPENHFPAQEKRNAIEMTARFFVYIFKNSGNVTDKDINLLYTLFENLFKQSEISWELFVGEIIEKDFDLRPIVKYLRRNLIQLDKLRIIGNLIMMLREEFSKNIKNKEIILDYSKQLGLEPEGIQTLIESVVNSDNSLIDIQTVNPEYELKYSLFTDFVTLGSGDLSNVRFRDESKYSPIEISFLYIDKDIFAVCGAGNHITIKAESVEPGKVFMLPENMGIMLNGQYLSHETIDKLHRFRTVNDVISFRKEDSDFVLTINQLDFSIELNRGTVYQNGHQLSTKREQRVYFDDRLRIKGLEEFNLFDVIKERESIGVENLDVKELYINFNDNYFYLSETETSRSIIYFEADGEDMVLYQPKKGWKVFLNGRPVDNISRFKLNKDIITINKRNFRINSFFDLIEVPFNLKNVIVSDLRHVFSDGSVGLDSISFNVEEGELVGILGQSGCGKSTLLKALCGMTVPTGGMVTINNKNLYNNINYFSPHIGYVPQDELLFHDLTVYENLFYRGSLLAPKISKEHLDKKIDNILQQVNLVHKRDSRVGNPKTKLLSGGERKRLNLALELLSEPSLIICDEPTSGLSFSDADQIVTILKNLTEQGKIVILTIHQPNSRIYNKFDKVLLMDMGGIEVFYGTPETSFTYFNAELKKLTVNQEEIRIKREDKQADFPYDVIMYPEYSIDGRIVYEQINKSVSIKRKFSPEYWRNKHKRKKLGDFFSKTEQTVRNESVGEVSYKIRMDFNQHVKQLINIFKRNLTLKLRNKTNMMITFLQAPILALVVSFILRLSPTNGSYSYYENVNMGVFNFVSIIIFIFFGLSNSLEDIASERRMLIREKSLSMKVSYYTLSKFVTLTIFTAVQVLLYLLISSFMLQIRGVGLISFVYILLAGASGFSFGLFISCYLNDSKSIINILPLVLIPQIIFAGAIIEYEKMNRRLTISEQNPIPEVVQVMPSRWLFEGLITGVVERNAFNRNLSELAEQSRELLSDLESGSIDTGQYKKQLYENYDRKAEVAKKYPREKFTNRSLELSVHLMDGRFMNTNKNVFLASYKKLFNLTFRTYYFNLIVIMLYIGVVNFITLIKLKYYK